MNKKDVSVITTMFASTDVILRLAFSHRSIFINGGKFPKLSLHKPILTNVTMLSVYIIVLKLGEMFLSLVTKKELQQLSG